MNDEDAAANDREHHELRMSLGSYAMGHLPVAETAALEEHLDACPACTAELAELIPVARSLGELRGTAGPDASVAPPPELGDRVVAAVSHAARRESRQSWRRAVFRAGAAAVTAAAVAVVGVQTLTADDREPAPVVPLEAVEVRTEQPGLTASADLVDHTWGVEVKLTATGFLRGGRYRVAVLGVEGERYPAGGFVGTGTKEMDCNLNSSVIRDRASGFEVRDAEGQVVATSSFG